jgi:hypothetical protein
MQLSADTIDLKGQRYSGLWQGMGREFELPAEKSGEARTSGLFENPTKPLFPAEPSTGGLSELCGIGPSQQNGEQSCSRECCFFPDILPNCPAEQPSRRLEPEGPTQFS